MKAGLRVTRAVLTTAGDTKTDGAPLGVMTTDEVEVVGLDREETGEALR